MWDCGYHCTKTWSLLTFFLENQSAQCGKKNEYCTFMHSRHRCLLQLRVHTNGRAILVNATTLTNVDVNTGLQNIQGQTDAYNVSILRYG